MKVVSFARYFLALLTCKSISNRKITIKFPVCSFLYNILGMIFSIQFKEFVDRLVKTSTCKDEGFYSIFFPLLSVVILFSHELFAVL